MIKALSLSLAVIGGLALAAQASKPLVAEAPIKEVAVGVTVSASTSAWTREAATTTQGRFGVLVSNPGSNSAAVVLALTNADSLACDATITAPATTVRSIEISRGGQAFIPVSDGVCVYFLSLHTAAENVHFQSVKQ